MRKWTRWAMLVVGVGLLLYVLIDTFGGFAGPLPPHYGG